LQLTEQQRRFFEAFGYLGFPGLITDDIGWITDEFEDVFRRCTGAGTDIPSHTGGERTCIVPSVGQSERLCGLLDDPRILGIIAGLLGDEFSYLAGDSNFYSGDTHWHSDSWSRDVRWIKIAFYFNPLTRDTGCLRVIPWSHRLDDPYATKIHDELPNLEENWGVSPQEVSSVPLEVKPGELVLFNQRLKHAAFGGNQNRRMFTMNFCEQCQTPEQIESLRDTIGAQARFWVTQMHSHLIRQTGPESRTKYLQQITDNEDILVERIEQERESRKESSRG